MPEAIAAVEGTCVTRLVCHWLGAFERARPPFTVVATEQRTNVSIAGYTLDIRLDRVDALDAGGVAVIDYKTGPASPPVRWFEPRPQGMQVALYATAREAAAPGMPVRALVYAQLRPGEVKVAGLGADPLAWPALAAAAEVKGAALADWDDARSRLQASLVSLATDFGRRPGGGDTPRHEEGLHVLRSARAVPDRCGDRRIVAGRGDVRR